MHLQCVFVCSKSTTSRIGFDVRACEQLLPNGEHQAATHADDSPVVAETARPSRGFDVLNPSVALHASHLCGLPCR